MFACCLSGCCANCLHKKRIPDFESLKPLILLWAQQDLNLWPADYESAALTD
jgi:hypothetical protein